jgi:hypothetical protein
MHERRINRDLLGQEIATIPKQGEDGGMVVACLASGGRQQIDTTGKVRGSHI